MASQSEGIRARIKMSDNEIVGHFERLGYRVPRHAASME
jgi:hypothetical protein